MKKYPFCPVCGADGTVKLVKKTETINIKGTEISVETEVYRCSACGDEFASLSKTFDFINLARQKYRVMFHIPSPNDIREFMDKYGFSLRDMEKLTGIAFKTIDRYLKGAIPDPSNVKFLKVLLNNCQIVLFLMNDDSHFEARKFDATREMLEKEIQEKHSEECPVCKFENKVQTIFDLSGWFKSTPKIDIENYKIIELFTQSNRNEIQWIEKISNQLQSLYYSFSSNHIVYLENDLLEKSLPNHKELDSEEIKEKEMSYAC